MAAPKTFMAHVKSLLSGDTLVLTSTNNPTLERTLSLAYVNAPHLRKEGDEPFAFQSREYLRALILGKPAKCTILYSVPSGREYGTVELQDGTQLPDDLVKAGWVKVREDAGRKEESEDILDRLETLRSLESQARDAGKGLHAGTGGVIAVQNDLGTPDFFNQWKGKTVPAIVERVLSGDRLLCRLMLDDKKHLQLMTLVAGIRTPATERTTPSTGMTQAAEEYGNEARGYVETRLLQRDVKIVMVGVSPQGQLVGHVLHPRGSIAEFLLADGLARCNDFHSTMLGEKMAPLRAAEKKAQIGKLRLHKNSTVKETEGSTSDMIVSKVIGADMIIVRTKTGEEKQVSLSSVRGPRAKEPSEGPFRDEAKEWLRKRIIGKHVKVSIDGHRPASEGFEARDVATVTEKGKNVNLQLVQEGYCSVIRHRKDDTDRAQNYDELLAAQETAKEAKKGMWSGKAPKVRNYMDASESVQKAKIQLSTLQRQKKVPGIVDFCKAGSRFTVLIPREGVKITMVLAGVRAPRAPRLPQEKGEPFGQEALDLANRRCNQRDVEIDIHDIDKVGGFIGDLYINRESFAKVLVEEGFASVHQYSAEKAGNSNELNAAEKRAKEARLGMWKDWDPSQDEDDEAEAPVETANESATATDKKPADYREVVVTNIDGNGKLKIQEIGKGTSALEIMMNEFNKFHLDSKNSKPLENPPKAGDFVSAKFSADGQWYRAKIRSNDRTAKVAEVVYIDYGNSEKISWSNLRPLNQPQFTTQKLKAQAVDAVLSYIQLPTAPDYFRDALDFIADVTDGKTLVASFDFVDTKEGLSYITLFESKSSGKGTFTDSINKEVVANGHAMIPKKLKNWERGPTSVEILSKLREVESQAKQERMGMWEYGDITED
ncbi:nuclease (SNase-like) [Apiospora marii]|uniref:nuclease (SNase-like) n=1 Tax=Apiospora marii TaxID=335849 RepID=UPI00312F2B42